jgi:hypothetical protein
MKRATIQSIISNNSKKEFKQLPKLTDIIVNLSVRETPEVIRKLRLVGIPIEFVEYQSKKRVVGEKGKTEKCAFPDFELNKNFTRIGHPDQSQCPWKKLGFVGQRKFAQQCFEEQSDGTWLPKIICKGSSIFSEFATWEQGRLEENDDSVCTHLGGKSAPTVKIKATYDSTKLGEVDYKVYIGPKDMPLTEDMINELRKIREPSADEIDSLRAEYLEDQENSQDLPEWNDFFEYGYDLNRIFKFTPMKTEDDSTSASSSSAVEETTSAREDTETDTSLDGINW